jgi:hypothetical protein
MADRNQMSELLAGLFGPDREVAQVNQLLRALRNAGHHGLNVPETIQRSELDVNSFVDALSAASESGQVESFSDRNTQRLRLKRM